MKRTGVTRRVLAMLLVIVMTLQILPVGVFAYGELKAVDTGIKVNTIKQEDAINWPIKIYDYLSDGMLFEWNDSTHASALTDNSGSYEGGTAPYGGGVAPPVTVQGADFTNDGSTTSTDSNYYNDYIVGAVDYQSPRFLRIEGKGYFTTGYGNYQINTFGSEKNQSEIRYLTVAYRSSGLSSVDLTIALHNGSWCRTNAVYLQDSSEWTYKVIDLDEIRSATVSGITTVYFLWGYYSGKGRGMPSGARCEFSHVGYFADEQEAHNYGNACVEFDNNPGEYLEHAPNSFKATTTVLTPIERLNYIFSLHWNWKNKDDLPEMGDANSANVYYGMDFTTTSKDAGDFTNAYTTDTYWTWEQPASQFYKFTENGITRTDTFYMDAISVDQRTESNGAGYVRLTNAGPGKILLSKFREDLAKQADTWIPETSEVNHMVLVYRANNLSAADKFGLFAQGYDASSANADFTAASNWKYAGLLDDASSWASSDKVNPQSFSTDSGWQFMVINLTDTIKAKDTNMSQITRLARTGLYLPALTGGKSLDLAYVAYFNSETAANTFGQIAKDHMNTPAVTATSSVTKTWGNTRKWNAGNNKGFGMLRATGGGNWATTHNGGDNTKDDYGYFTWMLGYDTSSYWNAGANVSTYRRDPITGELYTAKYTSTDSRVINQNATGTTNNIYYINSYSGYSDDGISANENDFDTSVLDFDGYELLETIGSNAVVTVGLLEGSLRTVNVGGKDYRVPVYRQEAVEYIAYLLVNALRIPQRDVNGNYNMNYIAGAASSQFGGVDLNGDGQIGEIDLDGDPRNGAECDEASVDLATALRHELGITLSLSSNVGLLRNSYEKTLGTYEETLKKSELLMGEFSECRNSIETAMDAAYYMLNSLFIANSFNQPQNDYYYLQMPTAELEMHGRTGTAYVFDAGFTTGLTGTDGAVLTDDGTNKSAISYSPLIKPDGTAGTGTIYMSNVTGKTQFNYSSSGNSYTTRFPFLPVTDATGDYEGGTHSYSFWDDKQRIYNTSPGSYYQANADAGDFTANRRNYNYVIASNGEFVYNKSDALFFDFEGDDDVYLFINGELVMDNGAAHSITGVYFDVNDYVDRAREIMSELYKYGYTNDMPIEEFDEFITAPQFKEYVYDGDRITGTKLVDNKYSDAEIANFKRWARLDLVDGQICQFDFYYMERHGWGANMRIVTNMHITDPALEVEKTAYQYGQEIEYGGVIDPTASMEYNFSLTNSGNMKLYNLTFKDEVIGVTLDPENGLTVSNIGNTNTSKNGLYVLDSTGHELEAKDLTAVVKGYNARGQYLEIDVTFPEVNDDGGQTALKNFLHVLDADGLESGYDDTEVTHAGSGLWVDATVIIKGIHYMLDPEQMEAGTIHNTVYLTATTKTNPNMVGNRTLYSDDDHRIYTSGFPVHYQWAGHNIFMKIDHLIENAKKESTIANSQLSTYAQFFTKVNSDEDVYFNMCDKYGRTGGAYPYHTKYDDPNDLDTNGNKRQGVLINYDEPGIYTFYMLMYLRKGTKVNGQTVVSRDYPATGIDAEEITEGEYAIIRGQVYVADAKDSVFVLDYGLSTESLDVGGELFKNDYLFGRYGTVTAKLMGASGTQPSYVDPEKPNGYTKDKYSSIVFDKLNLSESNVINAPDGIYKVNLSIPDDGKNIGYDSATGEYTLTGVGTVTVYVNVPADGMWAAPRLYYWYNDAVTGPAWPGTVMTHVDGGLYKMDIPADVSKVIVNNGSAAMQTEDLTLTPGLESTITIRTDNDGKTLTNANSKAEVDIHTVIEEVPIHVTVPSTWEKAFLHHWHDNGETTEFPGEEMEKQDDGSYLLNLHGDVTHIVISDGSHQQSGDISVYAGKEAWIDVTDTETGSAENDDGTVTKYYQYSVKYTLNEGYKVHASVPATWKDEVYLYFWRGDGTVPQAWPGYKMEKGSFGWYTYAGTVPADVTQIIISDDTDGQMGAGDHQTIDLTVTPGLETWVTVKDATQTNGKYTADIAYGSESSAPGLTFTPNKFMDEINEMWLALTVHATAANPSKLNNPIDIHNELQMYKKITVVPATVVYYEDSFQDIDYNNEDTTSENVFIYHGTGSGRLSQSVDQAQPYGQDAAYQDSSNELYSGNSMLAVKIMDTANVATFTFKGTGFELISRTNATDSASIVARVYKSENYSKGAYDKYVEDLNAYYKDPTGKTEPVNPTETILPVITQFDHGNDGGNEAINQVPTVRITGLEYGEYTIELHGMPLHTFDPDNNFEITGTKDTYLYIDGLRIFQPMGPTHDAYTDAENGAQVMEIRNLIMNGQIAVGALEDGLLKLSTGTVTWTENLTDNDFDPANSESYEGIKVDSTDDYLIKGPNNEVYMEGNASNSAMVFYVSEDAASQTHELQIAVRALDYSKFYGAGSSALNAQLQYGVLLSDGTYAWKHLVRVFSGTEQYYSIPYTECPVDSQGRYQIAIQAVNPDDGSAAMVSYTSVKLNGLKIEKDDNLGEATILYYLNGMLVRPEYELVVLNPDGTIAEVIPFNGNELSMKLDREWTYVHVRATLNDEVSEFFSKTNNNTSDNETLYKSDGSFTGYPLDIPKGTGEVTLKIKRTTLDSLNLSYCLHTWDEGKVTREPNCTEKGVMSYTCSACGHVKHEDIATNHKHTYSGSKCIRCGADEPKLYLVGYMNGMDYSGENYRFVDSKLVLTFNADSYVAVKNEAGTWFMTDGWLNPPPTSCKLYDSNTIEADNKLMVPSGVELTFTVEVNEDGTLTLSYTLPCNHQWDDGVIAVEPSCTEPGEKILTCAVCKNTMTQTVEATGHSYQNGVCTVCGEIEMITVYFENSNKWAEVYVWAWNTTENFTGGTWPGVTMTPVEGEEDIYSFTLPATATGIIFNSGTGVKTEDLSIPTDGRNLYSMATKQWTVKGEVLEYYLVGYINGVDYGFGIDEGTQGIYKFVNGKLEITFESDSYVFVKTTGNANRYMTEGYPGDDVYSATLYNTNTGLTEANKLKAPGGMKLTIVLEDKGNDTFQLTVHAWGEGVDTIPATCTTNGVRTYTCSLCQDSYTEVIPATGHTFEDGVCGCGELELRRIYFRNTAGWDKVYLWGWKNGGDNYTGGNWPGVEMTLVEGETDLYYYDLAVKADKVIFSGGGTQTGNLTIPTDGKVKYTYGAKVWTTLEEEPELIETKLYLKPNANWTDAGAWFSAWFFNGGSGDQMVKMTDSDGDGYYEVTVPDGGYSSVIFVRQNPASTSIDWTGKWDQTSDLAIPIDGTNCYTVAEGAWSNGDGSWSTYTPAGAASVMTVSNSLEVANAAAGAEQNTAKLPDTYIVGDEQKVLNLFAISQQLSSDVVIGEMDNVEDDVISGGDSKPDTGCTDAHSWSYSFSEAEHTFTCAACGEMMKVENTDGKKFGIKSAAPILTDDINLRFHVEVPAAFTNVYMTFTFNGEETTVTDYTVAANGRYCFVFEDVNPQQIGDSIDARLYGTVNGEQIVISYAPYSVRQYCVNMLADETISTALRTLLSDLLVYGAKTQIYQGYKTDALVTEGLELTPGTFTGLDESFNKQQMSGVTDPRVRFTGATLILHSKMTLRVTVATADPTAYTYKVAVNGNTTEYTGEDLVKVTDGKYYLYFDNLKAMEFNDTITVSIEQDGVQVGKQVSYSVNTYIYNNQNTGDVALGELLEAIYNYGAAAEAYFAQQ